MLDSYQVSEAAGLVTGKKRQSLDNFIMYSDVEFTIRDKFGNQKHYSFQHNLRTNAGADFWNTQLFSTSPGTAGANYIALTTDTVAPAAADTTLTSELTTNGLGRAQATVTHTAAASSTQLSHTWTYTGSTSVVIAKVGLFNAATVGTMVLETLLTTTGTVSANGDTITVTWTINF